MAEVIAVLDSGGADSRCVLEWLDKTLPDDAQVFTRFIDFGLPSSEAALASARKNHADGLTSDEPNVLTIQDSGNLMPAIVDAVTGKLIPLAQISDEELDGVYRYNFLQCHPAYTKVVLDAGFAFAREIGATKLYTGLRGNAFIPVIAQQQQQLNASVLGLINLALDPVDIIAPFVDKTLDQEIQMAGVELNVLHQTVSCNRKPAPCGYCPKCLERQGAGIDAAQ